MAPNCAGRGPRASHPDLGDPSSAACPLRVLASQSAARREALDRARRRRACNQCGDSSPERCRTRRHGPRPGFSRPAGPLDDTRCPPCATGIRVGPRRGNPGGCSLCRQQGGVCCCRHRRRPDPSRPLGMSPDRRDRYGPGPSAGPLLASHELHPVGRYARAPQEPRRVVGRPSGGSRCAARGGRAGWLG